jgi:hypothetical protein
MECCEECKLFEACEELYPKASDRPPCAPKLADRAQQPTTGKVTACPACHSANVKCRGSIMNCEDCGERW